MALKRERSDAVFGLLVINWKKEESEFHGMDGDGEQANGDDVQMTAKEVLRMGQQYEVTGYTVWYLIFWTESHQLSSHDRAGFSLSAFERGD